MGFDYIQRSHKTFQKKREKSRHKLGEANFLTVQPRIVKEISVCPETLSHFRSGDAYELVARDNSIDVFSKGNLIGTCDEPPGLVMKYLSEIGGRALGVRKSIREISGVVDIEVCHETRADEKVA